MNEAIIVTELNVILGSGKVLGELFPGTLPTTAAHDPLSMYIKSLTGAGPRTMLSKLKVIANIINCEVEEVEWSRLRAYHVLEVRNLLIGLEKAPATINATLSALKGVAKCAWMLGGMTAEEYQQIATVKGSKGSRLPAGRDLSVAEITALMDACRFDITAAGARDAALIAVLYCAGLRRSEAAGLELSDYDRTGATLTVRGKGNKERLTPLEGNSLLAVDDWIRERGEWPGALFCPVRKNGAVARKQMSDQAIYNAMQKRGDGARVELFTPHDFRRTLAGDLLDAGADLNAVKELFGHANIQTTARYDRRGERAKRKAASLIHLPYLPRKRANDS